MKFLCDVHISYGLVNFLQSKGLEATHVNKILDGYHTSDNSISNFADENGYVVISKDSDFKNSFLINKTPKRLIKVNLGNLSNAELIQVFTENLGDILNLQVHSTFMIELGFGSMTFMKGIE